MLGALKLDCRLGIPLDSRIQWTSAINNRAESAMIIPNRAWAQFVPLQTANSGYAAIHERAGPPNMGLAQAPTLDALRVGGASRVATSTTPTHM
ncbi:hypothetical protein EDB85DRAFT_2146155 [Lactarius pseudohatsudake]|nr:hypothetical protein EDB85DRAFT_2146155 [Lactarius pseudohatsudake]